MEGAARRGAELRRNATRRGEVVRRGAVRCGEVVRCGAVRCGAVRCGAVRRRDYSKACVRARVVHGFACCCLLAEAESVRSRSSIAR